MSEILVTIKSEAWLKEANSYMNIEPQMKEFFPDDCFIARGTGRENQHRLADRGIQITYQANASPVQCFMELRDSGHFRPSGRGSIKSFYTATNASVGDTIVIKKLSVRMYSITLAKNKI